MPTIKLSYVTFLLVAFVQGYGQSILPSTVREVFNFSIGDTFVYQRKYCVGCLPQYGHEDFFYVAINSKTYSSQQDTVFYDTNRGELMFTDLDSSVLSHSLQPIQPFGSQPFCFYYQYVQDSVYYDTLCSNKKINISDTYLSLSCLGTIKYADNLGVVEQIARESQSTDPYFHNWDFNLIYSSTQSGVCGTYPSNVINSFPTVVEERNLVKCYPGPTSSLFTVELLTQHNSEIYIQIFDCFGTEVFHREITAAITTCERKNFLKGIYIWRVRSESKVIANGKISFE